MTLLEDRPVATPPAARPASVGGSTPAAWRFAARLARREVRRRPGRTVLVAVLVAVPVMAMTVGSVLARTNADDWAADFRRDYGDADIVTGLPWISVAAPDGEIPAVPPGGIVIGRYLMVSTHLTPADGGEATWADVTDLDPTNPAEWSAVEVTSGDAPGVGEILLGDDVADRLGVGVGDRLELDRPSGSWIVSGFGRMRGDYWRELAVIPGFDPERIVPEQRNETTLIDLPDSVSPAEVERLAAERGGLTRYQDPFWRGDELATGMAWGYVAGLLALVAVGIIVAAAFATSARRQLVTIGQLTANGASEAVVRRSLSLQGTWSAAVGAVVGILAGFALLPVARPIVADHILQHELRATRIAVGDLIVVATTAVVVATIAAAVPARSASRVPVMSALAGRRPVGSSPAWLVPTGLALFGGGLGLVALAAVGAAGSSGNRNIWAGLVVLGATGAVFGTCCASPLVVERIGRLGGRTTLSWRMALRGLGRSRARNAAVVAAIAVAIGGAVAGTAVLESAIRSNYACCDASLPPDAIRVDTYVSGPTFGVGVIDPGPLQPFEPPAAVDRLVDALGASTFPVLAATFDPVPFDPESDYVDNRGPMIATPELLDVIGLDPADARTLRETGLLAQSYVGPGAAGDSVSEALVYRSEDGPIELTVAYNQHPSEYLWFADVLMTEPAARAAGFDIVPTGLVIRAGAPLTPEQIDLVRGAAQTLEGRPVDAFIEPGDPPITVAQEQMDRSEPSGAYLSFEDPTWRQGWAQELWIARGVLVGAALVLSLLVVSIGLTLAAVEGREERDVFAVVGATPATMRRQAAARAAVVTLVGIGLGIPLGFTPTWVVDRVTSQSDASWAVPVQFPWLAVAAMLVIIPAVAAGGAWAGSGLAQRLRPASPTRRD